MNIEKDWSKKDSYELILLYQDENQSKSVRDSSFYTLVIRFRKDIIHKCEIICKSYGHNMLVAEQIAEATFKSYAKKGAFELEKSNIKNVDIAFKIYLYGIAKRELINFYRLEERKKNGFYSDGTERIVKEIPTVNSKGLSIEIRVKLAALNSLPDSHKVVYLTYTKYEKLGCNLPRKLQKELREYLGVTQGTIRTYKKEAKDKIEEYLDVMRLTQTEI